MKAVQYSQYGGIEVLTLNSNVPKPTISDKQVLVEVYAASINPIDWKIRLGYLKENVPLKFPATIAGNFSGVVTEVGKDVATFKPGDEVYGQALVLNDGSGSLAEFTASNVDNTAFKPQNLTHQEAASLPLVGVSAIQALEQHINLQKGPTFAEASAGRQKIFINGGSGGIGTIAIQLAKHLGAYVVASASTKNVQFVKDLGADEVIDYTKEQFEEKLNGFDAIFNSTEEIDLEKAVKILKQNGIVVAMSGHPDEEIAKKHGVRLIRQGTDTSAKNLTRLTQLVEQNIIKPQVDKVFLLEQFKEAFEYAETGHPKGKVVVQIKE